ncbi:MAG TPA: Dickkopf N-terminal cysteine-rich domain-containing protein, partial [Polyangiaceae bacterium]|nr:Dickkopf N-terminal cysteine-rich domain-containing protein [Polyangiaceae bacterium]
GGGACTQDSDCAKPPGGSATCFDDFSFADGGSTQTQTCIQTTPGMAGDGPCVGDVLTSGTEYVWSGSGPPPASGVTCALADSLTCDQPTQKCKTLGATGQPCNGDSDCVPADYCAFASSAEQCTVRIADGAPCSADLTGCLSTSYCDTSTTTCKPLLTTGSSCTSSEQCASTDCVNDVCSASNNLGLELLCGSP